MPAEYPTPAPVETDPVAEADLGAHAALITGVHGVPAFTTGVDDGKGLIWGNGGWQKTATPLVTTAALDQLTPSRLGVNSTIAANTQARIVAQGSAYTPLVLRGAAGQTADLFQTQDSTGTPLARVDSTGKMFSPSHRLEGSSTSRLVLASATSPASNLLWNIDNSSGSLRFFTETYGAQIPSENAGGSVKATLSTSGLLSLTTVATAFVQATSPGASSIPVTVKGATAQAADLQQWQDSAGAVIGSIDPAGQIDIGTGGFNLLRSKDGATNRASLSSGSVSIEVQNNLGTTAVPFVVRGGTGQTGNLQDWRDVGGVSKVSIENGGRILGWSRIFATTDTASGVPLTARGMAGQTGNLQEWQDSTGVAIAKVDPAGNLNAARLLTGGRAAFGNAAADATAQAFVAGNVATDTVLRVKGAASQTGNLQEWQDSGGGKLAAIDAAGRHYIANSVAPATPTLGGILYVAAGALRFKGSAGTDTLIANA